jgi:hypothetical protein
MPVFNSIIVIMRCGPTVGGWTFKHQWLQGKKRQFNRQVHFCHDPRMAKSPKLGQTSMCWDVCYGLLGGDLAISKQLVLSLTQTSLELGRRGQRLIVRRQPWKWLLCIRFLDLACQLDSLVWLTMLTQIAWKSVGKGMNRINYRCDSFLF